ncbi:MAG: F0F1 ATP synthase subunit A [Nitrospirae bacterium]|nr:F0F1 ATP synthase subunit A [Nitrospirota bacterium]
MENPLHHFELHNVVDLHLGGLDLSISQGVITMWVVVAAVFMLFAAAARRRALVPVGAQNVVEMGVEFIRNMAEDNIGKAGVKYVPFLISLFFFVLFGNLLGLVPGVFTITSQLFVTAVLAVVVYVISLVVGFRKHGSHFLSILVPGGTPGWLIPLMIPIEILSQLARPISLAVRLFANMTAGHTILAVLFGMTVSLPLWAKWLPFGFTVIIYGLELFIAFIQAYIFVMLSCVYLGDAENLAH